MTAVEDRTRAAMDAITGLTERPAPPLTLPPPATVSRRSRWRRPSPRRRWGPWLAPVTAAVAVVAIAIALVVVRDMPDGQPTAPPVPVGPVAAATGIPTYNLTLSQNEGDTTVPVALVLNATLTGKKLFTLAPPRGLSFAGITGAADDRTFVADAHRDPFGVRGSEGRSRTWYLVRVVGSGARASLTMRKLSIPPTPVGTGIEAIALSPDATMLAVASERVTDNPHEQELLQVYSVATGAVLHTWSSPADQYPPIDGEGFYGGDSNTTVVWVGERALAFNQSTRTKSRDEKFEVETLDLSRPDGDLLGSSRIAAVLPLSDDQQKPAPYGCNWFWDDVMITGDGKSYVCGGSGTSSATLPKLYCLKQPTWNALAFAAVSLTTGKLRILSGYRTGCHGYTVSDYPVWVNATGSLVIGYMIFGDKTSGRFGVFSAGSFRPLPYPIPGNSYQYEAGSLLGMIAW
ncbi:MAG TPA: hypothetical protein VHZ33_03565 [Trebonia sp.]|nr:hypothetical protein [Trebonia sp.]